MDKATWLSPLSASAPKLNGKLGEARVHKLADPPEEAEDDSTVAKELAKYLMNMHPA